MKFLIFLIVIVALQIDAQYWNSTLNACLTCDPLLFGTFVNTDSDHYGFPMEYREPCDCPAGVTKEVIDHACFPDHIKYPYYNICHHKAYCCEFPDYECNPSLQCPSNMHAVPSRPHPRCRCICNNYMLKCPNLFTYDRKTCKCECPSYAASLCHSNQYLDPKTCSCTCKSPCQDCKSPQYWNKKTCQCQCPPFEKSCAPGKFYNQATCKCECKQAQRECCPDRNFVWDPEACDCVCKQHLFCRCGHFDNQTCGCEYVRPPKGSKECDINLEVTTSPSLIDLKAKLDAEHTAP